MRISPGGEDRIRRDAPPASGNDPHKDIFPEPVPAELQALRAPGRPAPAREDTTARLSEAKPADPTVPEAAAPRGSLLRRAAYTAGVVAAGAAAIPHLLAFVSTSVEVAKWGANLSTATFLGTIVLTAVTAWGFIQQLKTIKRNDSADSVPLAMTAIGSASFLASTVFGCQTGSLALAISGLSGLVMAGIAGAIVKRSQQLSRTDKLLCGATILGIPTLMACIPYKTAFFGLLLAAQALSGLQQPYALWNNRSRGAAEPKTFGALMISSAVWEMYALLYGNVPLIAYNACSFATSAAALALWCWFRPRSGGEKA